MTPAEKLIWSAAYAQGLQTTSSFYCAIMLAYKAIYLFRGEDLESESVSQKEKAAYLLLDIMKEM